MLEVLLVRDNNGGCYPQDLMYDGKFTASNRLHKLINIFSLLSVIITVFVACVGTVWHMRWFQYLGRN